MTGGKYNYYEDAMVAEHRGCSGSRFLKQVKLDDNAGYLSLGVRGSKYDEPNPFMRDRIDSTDDTVRLEILAITTDGFKPSAECQAMLETITTKEQSGANWSQAISTCMETFPDNTGDIAHQRPMLNHSLQFCSKLNIENSPGDTDLRDTSVIQKECKDLYTGTNQSPAYEPSELIPAYGAYICFGIYDSDLSAAERAGYVGRCWKPSSGLFKTCTPKPASLTEPSPENGCTGDPCSYTYNGTLYLNETPANGDTRYNYKCTSINSSGTFGCKTQNGDVAGDRKYWEQQYLWKNIFGAYGVSCTGPDDIAAGATAADWDNAADTAAVEECIVQASIDYCNDTSVPEVIDPSDQAGDTTKTWNIPGVLTDSQIIAQLGGTHPLAVMKGYIGELDRPQGIIHSVARDLRLGAMSFNSVGAATECQPEYLTTGIERYCPKNNKDGGKLLTPLEVGDAVVDSNDMTYAIGKRRHVDDLAQAINGIRATSWTPLGEALYGALGYYTQNINFCLNFDTDGNCLDFSTDKDPVQYWCQDNHILLITEGESTADINTAVGTFPAAETAPHFLSGEADDNLAAMLTADADGDTDVGCADSLKSSTFLDDMTWWGQHALPLYKKRYYIDPDGNPTEKQPVSTYIVTTGSLTANGTGECSPPALMNAAAKNGGTDANPDPDPDDTTPRDPAADYYYSGEDPQQLEANLYAVLGDIMSRSSSGSAASVISDSRSGAGAMYQAVFWPQSTDNATPESNTVQWTGDVRALLLDSDGLMYEDTNQDGKLDPSADLTNASPDGNDKQVIFYYSNNAKKTRGCFNIDGFLEGPDGTRGTSDDRQCPGDLDPTRAPCLTPPGDGTCTWVPECTTDHDCVEATDINYLWSANNQLRKMDVVNERKLFTWNDVDNDGIVDADTGEWFQLNNNTDWTDLNTKAASSGTRGPVTQDFLTPDEWGTFAGNDGTDWELDALNALTTWLLGVDTLDNEVTDSTADDNTWIDRALRSRQFKFPDAVLPEEWRLGDIIHSAPTVVSKPAEAYNHIYRDPTYTRFVARWNNRRNAIYFGGNDGMLHAVNGGYHLEEGNQFCCTDATKIVQVAKLDADGNEVLDTDGNVIKIDKKVCAVPPINGICAGTPNLGEELWAYIPYNLQPHLKCLADKFYTHKYYVDKKPRIFDVQIFPEDTDHVGGWGTILVGGMRFGGAPIDAKDLNDFTNAQGEEDPRQFTSSFFILDITNPDSPKLLGELSRMTDDPIGADGSGNNIYADDFVDLNYTTSTPAMVAMREDIGTTGNVKSAWYLVMGNGPTDLDGTNHPLEQGKLAVLPLSWLLGEAGSWTSGVPKTLGSPKPIRIPDTEPTSTSEGGRFLVPKGGADQNDPGYISDIISVDYNIGATSLDDLGVRYRTDALYFGTVDGSDFDQYPPNYLPGFADQFYWKGGGRVFRLVTKVLNTDGEEKASAPSQWAAEWKDNSPVRMLADLKMPVVSGPSVGYDGENYWIYTGTGRFHDEKDKTDDGWCLDSTDPTCAKRSEAAFFGIKEPIADANPLGDNFGLWANLPSTSIECDDAMMTWETVEWDINDQNLTNSELNPQESPGKRGLMRTDNILSGNGTGYLNCYNCKMTGSVFGCSPIASTDPDFCFDVDHPPFPNPPEDDPSFKGPIFDYDAGDNGQYTFPKLVDYIAGTGCETVNGNRHATGLDGWYHVFHEPRERNTGTASLLGEILFFATSQPLNDKCKAEGGSALYALYYQTGTGSMDDVIGTFDKDTGELKEHTDELGQQLENNQFKLMMDGLVMPPTLHSGTAGLSTLITGSSGLTEQKRVGTSGSIKSGRVNWTDRCGN
ncbi:MAG: hypothetical protein D3924_01135 [Candidatus Electrothrix sp. AR4]|nr:hypothetical protein [Candidatus Electrothrix sp. AR4]